MLIWKAHERKVRSLAFSPDGTRIATTADKSDSVWLWNPLTGELVGTVTAPHRARVRTAAFFPDGRHVAGHLEGGVGIRVWDAETKAVVAALGTTDTDSGALAVSPDGTRLLTVVADGVVEWTEPTRPTGGRRRDADRMHPMWLNGPTRIGFSPAGTYVCVAWWHLDLLHPGTLKQVRELRDPAGSGSLGASVNAFAFSPDDSRLVVAMGHRAAVWTPADLDASPVLIAGHGKMVKAAGFLPDRNVLTAGMDGTARVWNVNTGAELRSFDWGIGKVQATAVSPDGTLCAAGSADGRIVVWDVD